MSKLLLALLRRFLTLGAGEEGEEETAQEAADEGTGDDSLDDMLDSIEPTAKEAAPEPKRNREAELQADLDRERQARRDLETRLAPARSAADPDADREERELADAEKAGWTADQIYWMKRQHATARSARAAERTSQNALSEARDISDKTAFDRLEQTKPATFKRYADRVEAEYQKARAAGNNVPRTVILKLMIGDDVMNGKVKSKSKSAPAAEGTGRVVDRGRTPGARSDVNGKNQRISDRDARRERLRNMNI
jgi:hypothetical protein